MDELNTILGNIESLLEQAKMLSGNSTIETEETPDQDIEKILKMMKQDEEDEENNKMQKQENEEDEEENEINKSDEGTHGEDSAEDRIEDLPEETSDNIQEVAKTIVKMLAQQKGKKIQKSKDNGNNKVLKQIIDEQNQLKKSITNILEGLGIADEIKKINEVKKSEIEQRKIPNDPNELKKSLDEIKKMIGTNKIEYSGNGNHSLMKSLTDNDGQALKYIFGK